MRCWPRRSRLSRTGHARKHAAPAIAHYLARVVMADAADAPARMGGRAALLEPFDQRPESAQCGAGRTRRPVLEAVGRGHAAACLRLSGYLFGLF